LFAIFSGLILVLTPMVSSVKTSIVRDEVENKIDDIFSISLRILDLLKNIENTFSIKKIIKLVILLFLLFPVLFLVISLTAYGRWRYFTIIEIITLYFSILFQLIEHIIGIIFGIV
jgi:hypothetical protein